MKHISSKTSFSITSRFLNHDSILLRIEKQKAVCVIADGNASKGVLSEKWAQYLCDKTSTETISSLKAFSIFIDTVWEEFYEDQITNNKDSFTLSAFQTQGSYTTYTACWFKQIKDKVFYNWLSYGNSTVLVYNVKDDELFVPQHEDSLLGFLNNRGLINWQEDNLSKEYFISEKQQEFHKDLKIILATDVMAEHLVLSYLIIKSKEEEYWNSLSQLMLTDASLSDLLFQNRDAYDYNSFNELLNEWEQKVSDNTIQEYLVQLQQQNRIAEDDISLQVIAYDSSDKDYSTKHKPITIKSYPKKIVKPPKVVAIPRPKLQPQTLKSKKEAFMNVILDNNIYKLYHFTDQSNIASIKKHGGLYSWHYMLKNKIAIPMAGGDQLSRMLDARYGLQNYVRTSVCRQHPMMYFAQNEGRLNNPIILEIDPVVVSLQQTMFANMNATKKGHSKGTSLADLKQIQFDICTQPNQFNLSESEKPYYQAEVMVLEFIPSKYIMNLNKF